MAEEKSGPMRLKSWCEESADGKIRACVGVWFGVDAKDVDPQDIESYDDLYTVDCDSLEEAEKWIKGPARKAIHSFIDAGKEKGVVKGWEGDLGEPEYDG